MSERYEADGPSVWDSSRKRYICSAAPAGVDAEAEAQRIATALNAQAGVVKALRPLEEALANLRKQHPFTPDYARSVGEALTAAERALAAVREKGRE